MADSESTPDERNPAAPTVVPAPQRVVGGRYRLLVRHGGTDGLQFWRALDMRLQRDVAVTIVAPDGGPDMGRDRDPARAVRAVLARTRRLGPVETPGLARVLDVVDAKAAGVIVVAAWTRGRSLCETAESVPSPAAVARAVQSLATAAELAHRSGSVLSIDHPDRIRIDTVGNAVLAFPASLGGAEVHGDVSGLGAVLYALLTACWPTAGSAAAIETTVGGLQPAARLDGSLVAPHTIRNEVPYSVSALALRALYPSRGVRTAATIAQVLGDAVTVPEPATSGDRLPPVRLAHTVDVRSPVAKSAITLRTDRRARVRVPMLAVVAFSVLGVIGWWALGVVVDGHTSAPLTAHIGAPVTPPSPVIAPPAPLPQTSTSVALPVQALGPAVPDVLGCYAGYHHEPAPDGPCTADVGVPVQALPLVAPEVLPCYAGYHHDPAPDGPCTADTPPVELLPRRPSAPQVLPCYPGYHHDSTPDGPCTASVLVTPWAHATIRVGVAEIASSATF